MGVNYNAIITLGLPYEEFPDPEKLDDLIRIGVISAISPYFNAPHEDSIIGMSVASSRRYRATVITIEGLRSCEEKVRERWNALFPDLTPQLYLTPFGW